MYFCVKFNLLTRKHPISQPIVDIQGKQAQLGHDKAVSSVLYGRINGGKIIRYKKLLYNYNSLII